MTCSLHVPAVGQGNAQLELACGTKRHGKGCAELVEKSCMVLGPLKQPIFEVRCLDRCDIPVIHLFSFMSIFLIWQHFSKLWPLKGAISSAWVYDWLFWPCSSFSPDFKIFWGWYHCVHLLHFLFMKKSVKKWARKKHKHFVSLNLVLLLVWGRLWVPVFSGLCIICRWRLRTSEERPWDHKNPRWWHFNLGNPATCAAFQLPPADEQKPLGSSVRAPGANGDHLSCLASQGWVKWIETRTSAVMWRWRWLSRLGGISPGQ